MMIRRSPRRLVPLLLLVALAATGCPGLFGRGRKPPTSVLWLSGPSEVVAGPEVRRLEAAGVRELFLEVGELVSEGGELRLRSRPMPAPARRVPTTLVLRGTLPPGASATSELVEEVRGLMVGAEGQGLLPVGLHLDLQLEGTIAEFASVAAKVRKALPDGRFFSVTVDRHRLGEEEISRLARATDFWVVFLHGQRTAGPEDPANWDLQVTERDLRKIEEQGEPYLVGVVTLATATRIGANGAVTPLSGALPLYPLVTHPALELVPGFSLQGIDRQVLELRARAAAQVAEVALAPGDRVRIVRTPTSVVEEMQRLFGTLELPHKLGEAFFRLPDESDRLSLSVSSLAAALEPGAAGPELSVELDSLGAERGRYRFRVRLRNGNDEPTDVATLDHNFVSVHVPEGIVVDADLGDFRRMEVDRRDEPSRVAAVRRPDVARLFATMVEGHAELTSGPIAVRYEGRSMRVSVSGDFVLPDGRVVTIPATDWDLTP